MLAANLPAQNAATVPPPRNIHGGGNDGVFSAKTIAEALAEIEHGQGLAQDWIWETVLPVGGLALLAGPPKEGKTTFAAHLAAAVSRGDTFLSRTTKKTGVLWLGLEERPQDVVRRFAALDAGDVFYHPAPYRSRVENLAALAVWIKENSVGLVVVDTLTKFWNVNDENDAGGVDRALDAILTLARTTGATVLLLHHVRKTTAANGDDIRGSSAIFANMDAAIILRRDGTSRRSLQFRSRFSECPERIDMELRDGLYQSLGAPPDASKAASLKVFEVLKAEPSPVSSVAAAASIPESSARRLLQELLIQNPNVGKIGGGQKGDPEKFFRNDLTPDWVSDPASAAEEDE